MNSQTFKMRYWVFLLLYDHYTLKSAYFSPSSIYKTIIVCFFQEMEAYIRGLIPNLAQLRDMPAAFVQMYCRIAAHKFFFFCDPHRRGLLWPIL